MFNQIKKRQFIPDLEKRNGQALAELAIFGSLFLFSLTMLLQYALNFNYRQELNMISFRKALSEASALSQRGQSSQIVTLQDRSFPDAQDPTGAGQHYPVMAGSGVLWSNMLMYDYTDNTLPRMVMDINGQPFVGPSGELRTAGLVKFTFNRASAENKYIHTIKEADNQCVDLSGNPLPVWQCADLYGGGPSWKWEQRNLLLVNEEVPSNAMMQDGLVSILQAKADDIVSKDIRGKMADVDSIFNADGSVCRSGDCKAELITGVTTSYDKIENSSSGHNRYIFYVNAMTVYDYQTGDIDTTYNTRDERAGRVQQGIQPDYTKGITSNSSVTREENVATNPSAIRTVVNAQATETINRTVELNGRRENVSSELPTSVTQEWVTPND